MEHWYWLPADKRDFFFLKGVKMMNYNALLLDRFMDMFAIAPDKDKSKQYVKVLILYGARVRWKIDSLQINVCKSGVK